MSSSPKAPGGRTKRTLASSTIGGGGGLDFSPACTIGGGPYFKNGYHVVKGVDLVVPVDIYVPGCPPRPETLIEGILRLQDMIKNQSLARDRWQGAKEKVLASAPSYA